MPVPPVPFDEQAYLAQQCASLPALRDAMNQLAAGQQRAQVRDGDRWAVFHQGSVRELRAELRRLEAICTGCGRGSVRAGPSPYPRSGWGFGPRRSFF